MGTALAMLVSRALFIQLAALDVFWNRARRSRSTPICELHPLGFLQPMGLSARFTGKTNFPMPLDSKAKGLET